MSDETKTEMKKDAKKTAEKTAEKPAPPPNNIQFVGKEQVKNLETGEYETVLRMAPRRINDGEIVYRLPESNEQIDGFCHKNAAQIVALFPDDYKIPVSKGEKL